MPGPFVPASASAGPAAVRPYPRLSTSDTTNISYHQLPQRQYHHHPALDVSSHGSVSAFLPQAYHPSQHVSPQPAFPPPRPPRPPPIHQSSTATNRTYSSLPPQHVQQPPPHRQNPFQHQHQQQQRYPPPTAPPPAHPQAPMPYQMPTQAQIRAESDELQLQIEEEYRRVKQAEWEMVRLQTAAAGNQSRGSSAGFGHSVNPGSGSMYPSVPSGMTGSAPLSNAQTSSSTISALLTRGCLRPRAATDIEHLSSRLQCPTSSPLSRPIRPLPGRRSYRTTSPVGYLRRT